MVRLSIEGFVIQSLYKISYKCERYYDRLASKGAVFLLLFAAITRHSITLAVALSN